MSNNLHVNRAGFTLIELLAALAVLTMLVVLLFKAFSSTSSIMVAGSNEMEKNQVVRAVLQQIASDVERTAYSSSATNLYQLNPPTPMFWAGSGISNSTPFYCLSALSSAEGNVLGTVVNVGYQMAQTNVTLYGMPSTAPQVSKWVLKRGDDSSVDPNDYPASWWTQSLLSNPTYWKTLSENIVGVAFQFYTNADFYVADWNGIDNMTNSLPTSVGITIWAIDSVNYNLALSIDPSFGNSAAQRILTNNVHKYTSRVYLPQSTQN